jgi:hypothetical protein
MEGQGVPRPATTGDATDSSAEKGLEANRPPGTVQTGRPATGILGRCRRWRTRRRNPSGAPDPPKAGAPGAGVARTRSQAQQCAGERGTGHAWFDPDPVRVRAVARIRIRSLHHSSPGSSGGSQHKPGVVTEMWRFSGLPQDHEHLCTSGSLVADGVFAPRVPDHRFACRDRLPTSRQATVGRARARNGRTQRRFSPPDQLGAAMRRIRTVRVATQRTPQRSGNRLTGEHRRVVTSGIPETGFAGCASTPHFGAGTCRFREARCDVGSREVPGARRRAEYSARFAETDTASSTHPMLRAHALEHDDEDLARKAGRQGPW